MESRMDNIESMLRKALREGNTPEESLEKAKVQFLPEYQKVPTQDGIVVTKESSWASLSEALKNLEGAFVSVRSKLTLDEAAFVDATLQALRDEVDESWHREGVEGIDQEVRDELLGGVLPSGETLEEAKDALQNRQDKDKRQELKQYFREKLEEAKEIAAQGLYREDLTPRSLRNET